MGALGDLVIRLSGDNRRLRRTLSESRGMLSRFAGFAAKAALPVLGVGGLGVMMKSQMSMIDSTAKLSDQLQMQTERLVGLRHAAELTGAGTKTLDAGIATMLKRLGEAARGTGAATAALDELGLSAQRLSQATPSAAFYQIADAMRRVEEPARRNAIAANIFSKANMSLINTLALGKIGLAEVQREAERLGLTFSRDTARGVEVANDALQKIQSSIGAVFRQATIEIAPLLALFGAGLTDPLKRTGGATKQAAKQMSWFGKTLGLAADGADLLCDGLAAMRWFGAEARYAMLSVADSVSSLMTQLPLVGRFYEANARRMHAWAEGARKDAIRLGVEAEKAITAFSPSQQAQYMAGNLAQQMAETARQTGTAADAMEKIGLNAKLAVTSIQGMGKGLDPILELSRELASLTMSRHQIMLTEMQASGASPAMIDAARRIMARIDTVKAAKGVEEATAAQKLAMPEPAAADLSGPGLAGATRWGSSEAWSKIMEATYGGGGKGPMEQANKIAKQNEENTAEAKELLREMIDKETQLVEID